MSSKAKSNQENRSPDGAARANPTSDSKQRDRARENKPIADPAVVASGTIDNHVARANALGHHYENFKAAPRPRQTVAYRADPNHLQRLVGFELEMAVSLSRKGKQKVATREDLAKLDPETLVDDQAIETEDGKVFEWDEDSLGARSIEDVITPENGGVGRWHHNKTRGSRASSEAAEEHEFFDPLLGKTDRVFIPTKEQPFSVVEDYNNSLKKALEGAGTKRSAHTAIAEIVTEPRDEFSSEENFIEPMVKASEAAGKIEEKTAGLTERVKANAVFPGAPEDIYLGATLFENESPFQSTNASIQATFGVQLAGVPQLIGRMLKGPQRRMGEKEVLGAARSVASDVLASLEDRGISARNAPRLFGLLHLIAMYLRAGQEGANILKNKTPLLIRTHLTNIRIRGLGPEAEMLTEEVVFRIEKEIISRAQRGPEDNLMEGVKGSPTVLGWVHQALVGEIDSDPLVPLLGDMRQLSPEAVGPPEAQELAPVVEERQVPKSGGGGVDIPRNDWPALANHYRQTLLELNAPLKKTLQSKKKLGLDEEEQKLQFFEPFGGQLDNTPPEKETKELPKYGSGLPVGTIISRAGGKVIGEILEDLPEGRKYRVQLSVNGTKLEQTQDLAYSAPGYTVVKLG